VDLISRVDARKPKLAVADAAQRVKESEVRLTSDRVIGLADATSAPESRQGPGNVEQTERNPLSSLTIKAPADGMWSPHAELSRERTLRQRRRIQDRDRAWAGAAIAELPISPRSTVVQRLARSQPPRPD
jgi:hypothetical protein